MANTVIQLKYSDVTSTPVTLNTAEPAYSNSSNKLFIGQSDGSVVAIGGKYYTALVDAATSANTASTIVKRDSNNDFTAGTITANLSGNATTATTLKTARDIGLAGDATGNVSFDGSSNVTLTVDLSDTGVSAGTYGGSSQIPVFTVDAEGRLTSASNTAVSIAANLSFAGDTGGTGTLALATDTLTINGGDGIDTVSFDANNTVRVAVDNTVIRTTGPQSISGDLAVTGNLVVSGNTITQDVETLVVEDSLIQLAANNAADTVDIGLFGQYDFAGTKYTALFRDASDSGKYKLLTGGTEKPLATSNTVNTAAFSTGTLVADIEATTVTIKGINVLDKANGAYDTANSATTTAQNAYNTANSASTTATGAYNHANGAFNTANSASTTAGNAYNLANGTAIVANTDVTNISTTAGTYGDASIVPVFTLAANGRVSSVTNTTIAIAASAITSGTLGVARGGTGFSSYTANGVIVGGLTSTSALTSVASSTEGHVLQISSSGIPTFAHLNGGSF
jgi:hypothetical protein